MSKILAVFAVVLALSLHSIPSVAGVFHDAMGREVVLDGTPQRIVSLAPSLTEILYYLGLGDRVAGVTRFSYYPPQASSKPRVGTYVNLNEEKIISLQPDLVIGTADGNKRNTVRLLDEAGIPVYIVNPRDIRDVIETIAHVGRLCGVGHKALAMADALHRRVDRVHEKVDGLGRPLVFLQINLRPVMTVNRETFHHDVIRLAGGENMTADEPITYPRLTIEEVVRRRPDVLVISCMDRAGEFEKVKAEWMRWPVIPAVKNNRVHLVNSDLLDRPSPRIVQGLERMARIIHPEAGWDTYENGHDKGGE